MNRSSSAPLILLAVALGCAIAACSTTKTSLSAQAQLVARVEAAIKELQEQYNRRNQTRLASLLAPPLADDPAVAEALTALFRRADSVRAQFVIERVWLLDPDTVRVDLHWTLRAEPAPAAGGQPEGPAMAAGTARFTLTGKEPRLAAVQGDSPFNPAFDRPPLP
ncbi:MAG: hypothetical protein AB1515_04105 [Nitrospirota bacterium]